MAPPATATRAPLSATLSREQYPRSGSPIRRFELADFEDIHLPPPPSAVTARGTSYSPEPASPIGDFRSEHFATNNYRQTITNAFLDKCKLPPIITRATNTSLLTPPTSLPSSVAPSPTKSVTNFITSSNTASKASTRAKTASRALIDNFFHGSSAPMNIGILPSPPPSHEDEEYDIDLAYGMEPAGGSYTRAPPRTRPRRSSTLQSTASTTGGSRFGGWFSSARSTPKSPPKSAQGIAPEDPLLNLDISTALFPHGSADPLDPTSFHDLLTSAESLLTAFQNAYRAQSKDLRDVRAEMALRDDEVDEAETRARHLKMQLDGMAAQVAAEERKADMLQRMLEEERQQRKSEEESRRRSIRVVRGDENPNWKRTRTSSDSGFESEGDADSIFSANSPTLSSVTTAESEIAIEKQAEKVRMVRVQPARYRSPSPHTYGSADLRAENHMLKVRVAELEDAVEGCLEMVSGLSR